MKSQTLTINGIRTQIYSWGIPSNPLLLCLHGWMDSGASFAFLANELKNDFYCVAPDLRGFGHSGHTRNPLGYFFYEYVADVHALAAHFSPDSPLMLLGHSMGGNIASLYAGAFPERVSHFINLEGFGIRDMRPEEGPERLRSWITVPKRERFKVYPSLDAIAERLRGANPRFPVERARFVAPYVSKKVAGGYGFSADPKHKWPHPYLFQLQNVLPFWQTISARVLLVMGKQSDMGKWMSENSSRVHDELERRLAVFPKTATHALIDCGHMMHHEAPEQLAQEVRRFIMQAPRAA